jgi:lipopolysaccharide transport system ATP-binding protein
VKPILEIQNVSKRFKINHQASYLSLREKLTGFFKPREKKEDFWALNDISFTVNAGESIGIIGRNGAGKSTLLKILSRITPPTTGRIVSRGRIASLLEVGTGFHQELTGRENIFMNGSILGMKRSEIISKFDEIVAFSGTENFLDTPIKHYSSGMQLRLAFAVAAHLDPEILIIDEVLAVGDAEFQKKCLGKMNEVVRNGRTILFVSHNLVALQNLCSKGILLQNGEVHSIGSSASIIENYAALSQKPIVHSANLAQLSRNTYLGNILFSSITMGRPILKFNEHISFFVKVVAQAAVQPLDLNIAAAILDKNGLCLIHASNDFVGKKIMFSGPEAEYEFVISNILRPGTYSITLFLRAKGVIQDWLTDIFSFEVEDNNPYRYPNNESIHGIIFPDFSINEKDESN